MLLLSLIHNDYIITISPNAQEADQLYLNKRNHNVGLLRKEGDGIRIENSFLLETWAQEWDLNPDPEYPHAACPCFLKLEPLQAEAKNDGLNGKASQTKGISVSNRGVIKVPNGVNEISIISFMSLKSTLVTNQELTQERGMGLWLSLMTTTLKQDNQVAKLIFLTNERTPGPGAILLPLNQST
ncbi:hypothetical protein DSO57_1009196 [Entomophthora muscae]|uniref:Uncharacterized protein n=1 Tax=Entomophthora muscae TaxID=34485 RepID=A0ACC2U5F8_9FUNG|nr:hypothetical protein DSO57_1009196 [Entomophthora muscae]